MRDTKRFTIYADLHLGGPDGILFIHGHRLSYSEKKIKKWENRKVGIGKWGLKFIKFKNGKYKESKKKEPSNKIKEKCLQLCKTYNCHTIVYGHTHNTWDGMYLGIRIVNVGRGKTTKLL